MTPKERGKLQAELVYQIMLERDRQDTLKAEGRFTHTCADLLPNEKRLAVLAEEFGEVARAVCNRDANNLREELVQVAAVALAWLEGVTLDG
jgi:hypothetical protein